MKTIAKIGILTLFVVLTNYCVAQNTLLVYTKFPSQLNFIDAFNKVIPKKAIWSEKDGGYIVNIADLENTFIQSNDPNVSFKLSNTTQITKLISLEGNNKIALEKLFTNEKYCCERLSDKQKNGTEKILAMSVMKKGDNKLEPVIYDEQIFSEICNIEELNISWKTAGEIKQIYLVDVNNVKTIWLSDNYNSNSLTYENIKSQLTTQFEKNHKYQLNILLKNQDPEVKYVYEFDYSELAFLTQEYHFTSQDAVKIDWKTSQMVTSLLLKNSSNSSILWSSDKIQNNSFSYSEIFAQNSKSLTPGEEYILELKLDNNKVYQYNFIVLISKEEDDALKMIIE